MTTLTAVHRQGLQLARNVALRCAPQGKLVRVVRGTVFGAEVE